MSYTTIDSFQTSSHIRRNTLSRNSSAAGSRNKNSTLALTSITKTVSNYFFKPEKLPQAFEQKMEFRTVTKPFFTKNRRLAETKVQRESPLPQEFKSILRAKSTVIKQKKLQQFYINREGREAEQQRLKYCEFDLENSHSNLFRSNFPQKKIKRTMKSVSFDRNSRSQGRNAFNLDMIDIPAKAITIQSLTEDLADMSLKEKVIMHNTRPNKEEIHGKMQWRSLKKKQQPLDKENMEFMITPWAGNDNEDPYF